MQVSKEVYDNCDISATPLHTWGVPSVDSNATIPYLSAGNYYFICTVSGHCDAGMKLEVTVLPYDGLPVLTRPIQAVCSRAETHCSYAYSASNTPYLFNITVSC